jgi:hypothetical protein
MSSTVFVAVAQPVSAAAEAGASMRHIQRLRFSKRKAAAIQLTSKRPAPKFFSTWTQAPIKMAASEGIP